VKRLCKAKLDALAGANCKCEKEAYQTVTRAATVFVSYLTACAQEYTKAAKRATISEKELLDGIVEIDFEPFAAILELYMINYGDAKESERGQPKKKRKASAFLVYSAALREEVKNKVGSQSHPHPAVVSRALCVCVSSVCLTASTKLIAWVVTM
jgi:hypothetical protein